MKTTVDPNAVMGRMEWFRDLRRMFNKLGSCEYGSSKTFPDQIQKSVLIQGIKERAHKLELQEPSKHLAKSPVMVFSLKEVLSQISEIPETYLVWDKVIDALIQLSVSKKKSQNSQVQMSCELPLKTKAKKDPMLEVTSYSIEQLSTILDQTTAKSSFSNEKSSEKPEEHFNRTSITLGTLHRDQPTPANSLDLSFQCNAPQFNCFEGLLYLNIAGNNLKCIDFSIPETLVLLNASDNCISEFSLKSKCPNLEFLNLTQNQIKKFSILHVRNLKELFLGSNCISSAQNLCALLKLSTLDLTYNQIENFEDIATLSVVSRLNSVSLKGNPLCARKNYLETIKVLLAKVSQFDSSLDQARYFKLETLAFSQKPVKIPINNLPFKKTGLEETNERYMDARPATDREHNLPFSPAQDKSIPSSKDTSKTPTPVRTRPNSKPRTRPNSVSKMYQDSPFASKKSKPKSFKPLQNFGEYELSQPTCQSYENSVNTSCNTSRGYQFKTRNSGNSCFKKTKPYKKPQQASEIYQLKGHAPSPHLPPKPHPKHSLGLQQLNFENPLDFLSKAEERIRQAPMDSERPKTSVISQESINSASSLGYGNPVAAMMIGPPAVRPKRTASAKSKNLPTVKFDLRKKSVK